ncbi:MAG: M3 family oligoendopeptidase [Candidatus Dojkabacteria bacterium]
MKDKPVSWKLSDILKQNEFEDLKLKIQKDIKRFAAMCKRLSPGMSPKKFKQIVLLSEKISEDFSRLYDLPALMESVDQQAPKPKKMKEQAKDVEIEIENSTRPFWHWIKGKRVKGIRKLDNRNARRLFSSFPKMRYILERTKGAAKYTLSESEERILTLSQATGISTLLDLRSLIETEQIYQVKIKGKSKKISTTSELMKHVYSGDPKTRRSAYKSLFKVYEQNLMKYFLVYQSRVKDWGHEVALRSFPTPLSMRNEANDIEDETVDLLLEVVRENRGIFHEYFHLKSKRLGTKKLSRYDIYAPIGDERREHIPYSYAVNIVLDTFAEFSNSFADHARSIVNEEHIDSHPSESKQSGAFCATIGPKITPYILLNYTGRKRDISTLAHELGHGIHSLFASKQTVTGQNAPLPLAETASTFGEMITFERLLSEESSVSQKREMLMEKVADSYATILRQMYFLTFEIKAHNVISKGTTPESLSELFYSTLKEQFGSSVVIPKDFRYEWAYIPHIVRTPFYVYAYAFGELLSLALYSRYKSEGKQFISKFIHILAAGKTVKPSKLLKEIGIDISQKSFWQGSFEVISSWIKAAG